MHNKQFTSRPSIVVHTVHRDNVQSACRNCWGSCPSRGFLASRYCLALLSVNWAQLVSRSRDPGTEVTAMHEERIIPPTHTDQRLRSYGREPLCYSCGWESHSDSPALRSSSTHSSAVWGPAELIGCIWGSWQLFFREISQAGKKILSNPLTAVYIFPVANESVWLWRGFCFLALFPGPS